MMCLPSALGKYAVFGYFLEVGDSADAALEIALEHKPTTFTNVNETHRVWDPVDVPETVDLQSLFETYLTGAFATYEASVCPGHLPLQFT